LDQLTGGTDVVMAVNINLFKKRLYKCFRRYI